MKALRNFVVWSVCVLALGACQKPFEFGLDVYEIVHFCKNGTGTLEVAVDLTKAEKFMRIERFINRRKTIRTKQLIVHAFEATGRALRQTQGVSQLKVGHDKHRRHFKLSFRFSSIRALNRAMRQLHAFVDRPNTTYFRMDGRSLTRIDTRSIVKLINHYQAQDDSFIASFDLRTFFRHISYKTAYSFEQPVRGVSNKFAVISKNRRVVILKHHLLNEVGQGLTIGNRIFFGKAAAGHGAGRAKAKPHDGRGR